MPKEKRQRLVMETILSSAKTRKLSYWLGKISHKAKKFKWEILAEMSQDRMVSIERKKVFLALIPYRLCKLEDSRKRDQLIKRLNKCVLEAWMYRKKT